ncbi:TIGR02391 family protein, partial [bacterium]|nr:TIGR02391 family protein [bacterium]
MNISFQQNISEELWNTISKNYEVEDYSGAIQDAIYILLETIRERTGLELDGSALIGKAFGGTNPLLKINAFRTESQKN